MENIKYIYIYCNILHFVMWLCTVCIRLFLFNFIVYTDTRRNEVWYVGIGMLEPAQVCIRTVDG